MKLQMTWALLAGGIALAALTAMATATSGSETLSGTIVTSGVSGTRTVISSVVILRGVQRRRPDSRAPERSQPAGSQRT